MFILKEIAELNSGLVISRKKATMSDEVVKIYQQLNLRSINKNGFIDLQLLETLEAKEPIDSSYLTSEGDIVVRLTDPFTAVYITKEYEGLVVSSNFCIVKVNDNYSAKFLSSYLNSENASKFLQSKLQGSIMKNINMSTVADLPVPQISKERQDIIGKLVEAQIEKIKVTDRIKQLEELRIKALLELVEKTGR